MPHIGWSITFSAGDAELRFAGSTGPTGRRNRIVVRQETERFQLNLVSIDPQNEQKKDENDRDVNKER
jgi:hypothetical protein